MPESSLPKLLEEEYIIISNHLLLASFKADAKKSRSLLS